MTFFDGWLLPNVPQWLFPESDLEPLEHLEFNTFSMEIISFGI
jgi:hypothetical protein